MTIQRLAACLLGLLSVGGPSRAAGAAELDWPSFLRAGPSFAAPVLRETMRGDAYQLLSCGDGWCRIAMAGVTGFLPQAAVSAPPSLRPDAGRSARPSDCIGFRRGDGWPEMLCRGAATE